MKYDGKTGKKIPECRMDEIAIVLDDIKQKSEQCGGLMNPEIEAVFLLRQIMISTSVLVDMVGKLIFSMQDDKPQEEAEDETLGGQ